MQFGHNTANGRVVYQLINMAVDLPPSNTSLFASFMSTAWEDHVQLLVQEKKCVSFSRSVPQENFLFMIRQKAIRQCCYKKSLACSSVVELGRLSDKI